ncbi:hypothetical protein VTK26DRAFT_1782 [Humicola hyalothermophila]
MIKKRAATATGRPSATAALRAAPAMTGWEVEGRATPEVAGKPAHGAELLGLTSVLGVGPPLGTVRVVKRVVVILVIEVESCSGASCDLMPAGSDEGDGAATSVIGHTVVLTGTVSVVTCPILSGQSVTVGGQLVMVYVLVAKTVEVVQPTGREVVSGIAVSVGVTGQTVVETAMVSVTMRPGHLVTVGSHDVMVYVVVV